MNIMHVFVSAQACVPAYVPVCAKELGASFAFVCARQLVSPLVGCSSRATKRVMKLGLLLYFG